VALAKLDRNGNHLWSYRFGDTEYHVPETIAVAPDGTVAIAGRFSGTVDFGNGNIKSESTQSEIFVASFSLDGLLNWAKRFGGPYEQQTRSIAFDHDGNIGLTGVFKGSISFDDQSLEEQHPSDYCGFITKLDRFGNVVWCKRFGDPSVEQGSVVTFDPANNDILTAGFIRNKLPDVSARQASAVCLFARYDPSGVLRWSKAFGTNVTPSSLTVAADGRILFTGAFRGSIDLGTGPLNSVEEYDVFAAMFSPDGINRWSRRFGDHHNQFLIAGAHGVQRSVILAGSFQGAIDFGTGTLIASGYNGRSPGSEDVFLAIFRDELP
jgi:hypothetical protein